MKQTSRKTTTRGNILKAILANLLKVIMSAELVNANTRIIATAGTLANISMEIQDYNVSTRKTDEWTERIEQIQEERQSIYNSDDWLIRTFSNSNDLFKFAFILLAIGSYIAVIVIWIGVIIEIAESVSKKIKKNCKA